MSYDNGNCFEVAAHLLLSLGGGATLVHASVVGTAGPHEGTRYSHAWVEINGYVLDHSNGNKVVAPVAAYYEWGTVRESDIVRYTRSEARDLLLEHEHYGPWHEYADDVWWK